MKHYVVVLDWAENDSRAVHIIGVAHTKDEAIEIFQSKLVEERAFAEEHGYTVGCDFEYGFAAGEMGYWDAKHTELFIEEVGEDDEYCDEYVPSAENGDYSPSNPWDAPGMSVSDFI